MVTPLPEIPSDVLSLLEGYFAQLQQNRQWLADMIRNHRDEIGETRAHNWLTALDTIADVLNLELSCAECQDVPCKLGLHPIGRGEWACNEHKATIDELLAHGGIVKSVLDKIYSARNPKLPTGGNS